MKEVREGDTVEEEDFEYEDEFEVSRGHLLKLQSV